MTVLFVSTAGGGVDTYVRLISKELSRMGHTALILYFLFKGEKLPDECRACGDVSVHRVQVGNLNYYVNRIGLKKASFFLYHLELLSALRGAILNISRKMKIDLIEIPELWANRYYMAGIPYVVRLHSAEWTWRQMTEAAADWRDGLEKRLERRALKEAAGISSPCQFLADYIRKQCRLDALQIPVVPYPVDTVTFNPGERKNGPPQVLFVGRVERRKGADLLLRIVPRILQRFPDVQFVFAGKVYEDAFGRARTQPSNVRLLGRVNPENLPALYQAASVFVAPSRWDNSPNTIYEAMASGVPVVGTNVGGIGELIEHNITGLLIPPDNEDSLAEAVLYLLQNPKARTEMGHNGRERAVSRYGLRIIADWMVDFYQKCLNSICQKEAGIEKIEFKNI